MRKSLLKLRDLAVNSPATVNNKSVQSVHETKSVTQLTYDQKKKVIANKLSTLKDSEMGLFVGESNIPPKKLANAKKTFLTKMGQSEQIFIFYDSTVFGSAKEGFAFTNRGLYYKNIMENATFVEISDIASTSSVFAHLIVNSKGMQHKTALAVQNKNVAKAIMDIVHILKGVEK